MKNSKKKISVLAICLLLTVVIAVGGTLAYLFTHTESVINIFQPAEAPNNIEETMNGTVKENVYISVPSLSDRPRAVKVFVRVAMIATWQDADGNIASVAPVAGTDYKVVPGSSKWVQHTDGFYYYKESVNPGDNTENLFNSIRAVNDGAPAGHTLHIEILSQSIQAEGGKGSTKAVIDAWGVDPSTL